MEKKTTLKLDRSYFVMGVHIIIHLSLFVSQPTQQVLCNPFDTTGDKVADKVSIYSEKITDVVCCSRCREPQLEPSRQEEERQSLIESYREQLLTSSYHEPLQDNDLECSLAT